MLFAATAAEKDQRGSKRRTTAGCRHLVQRPNATPPTRPDFEDPQVCIKIKVLRLVTLREASHKSDSQRSDDAGRAFGTESGDGEWEGRRGPSGVVNV